MKQRIIFYFALLIIILINTSFRWPANNGSITSTFGESRGDHFHDGIDIVSPDDKIFPVDTGILLFFWDRSIFPLENYPGGGNYKIIKHKDGLYSIYMHLLDGVSSKKIYLKDKPVDMMGNSGHSFSKHLHFSILDSKERVSFNPFFLLPGYEDPVKPEILDIYLKIDDKYNIIKDNYNIRLTRHYPLLVKIVDTIAGRERLGIYKIKAIFNDTEVRNAEFRRIKYSKRGLTVSGKTFESLFDEKGYYKIDGIIYQEGKNKLQIVVLDYAGNRSEKTYTFNVKLDME